MFKLLTSAPRTLASITSLTSKRTFARSASVLFSEKAEEVVEAEAPKVPKKVAGVGNIYDIAKQINKELPANLQEVK
jgi:hypothetical protein